jgi:hypothetical protein
MTLTSSPNPNPSHGLPPHESNIPSMGVTSLNLNPMTTFEIEMQDFLVNLNKGEIVVVNFRSMTSMTTFFSHSMFVMPFC